MLAGAGLIVATARTSAHHAFAAEFDSTKPIKLRGTVVKMEWINPHTWIHLDVKTPKGTVERWMIEGGPPNALYRRGFTKKSSAAGRRDSGRGIPGEGWIDEGQRAGPDLRRRAPAVRRLLRHRRPGEVNDPGGVRPLHTTARDYRRRTRPLSGFSRSVPSRRCSRRTRIPGDASLPAASTSSSPSTASSARLDPPS